MQNIHSDQFAINKLNVEIGGIDIDSLIFSKPLVIFKSPYEGNVYDLEVDTNHNYEVEQTAIVHNGGKRRGAICGYLETWHIDIEDFLDLRKNTGDERRRTHDMNTANWIPDLFMERVLADETWTLFSPDETPDLHDLIGIKFKVRYEVYEQMARDGTIKLFKTVSAKTLWRKMLTMLFETGHPWVTFKDAFNTRYSNQHVGVIHSSNLCFTGDTKIAIADGRNAVSIKQLAEESQRINMIDVYSARRKVGQRTGWKTEIKPAIAFHTGVKDIVKVTLSDGSSFKCTPDHKLFKPNGEQVEAQHSLGETIESFFTYTTKDAGSKYRHINSVTNGHAKQHIMIYEHSNGVRPVGYHVDHIIDNGNDSIDNLQLLDADSHYAKTGAIRFGEHNPMHKANKDYIKKMRKSQMDGTGNNTFCGVNNFELYNLAVKFKNDNGITEFKTKHYFQMREQMLPDISLPKSFSKYRFNGSFKLFCEYVNYESFVDKFEYELLPDRKDYYQSANNDTTRKQYINSSLKNGLVVISVEEHDADDVYCLTVDDNHNFYIITNTDDDNYENCSGILVKNCTEIGLHTNDNEIAVCNLGSVNVTKLIDIDTGRISHDVVEKVVRTAVRMLDNVIDYNYYSVDKAANSNHKHRPIGLGIMGFQDLLYMLNIPYDSPEAVDFADYLQEVISYYAISASCDLARERGAYSTFEGSLWSKGILPIDSLQMLTSSRADGLLVSNSCRMPMAMWDDLRDRVKKYGMRNSNVMAIAPTATISNICGVSQSIEPTYQNVYVKSNLSGEFITINTFLVDELKKLGLWNNSIARQIINKDGSVQDIIGIPAHIKALFKTAFEIDSVWLINAASRRQKWIDQGQSLNLYMKNPSGKKLNDLYTMAWMSGLKSTYYLRTMAATGNEKTIDESDAIDVTPATDMKFCSIDNPDCESCQ